MEFFVGLDVSLDRIAICVLSSHGKVIKEQICACERDVLIAFLRSLQGHAACIGLEAGPLSQWLRRHLAEAKFKPVMMEPRQVKGALKAMPIKTDRRDAEGIARLLHMDWFRPVHCKSTSAQEMRGLLSARKIIVQAITNLELSIRGILRNFRLKLGHISEGGFAERAIELADGNLKLQAAAIPILDARSALRHELASLEKLLGDLARTDRLCHLFMTMPGVGPIVALTVKAAIDDPNRFPSSKDVGPWAGLTPRRDQSGERDIISSISRAGDAGLRTVLYQAAMVMLHKGGPSWLTAWALNVAKRCGKRRAMVALARRIGVILHRMWRDETPFRFTRTVPSAT